MEQVSYGAGSNKLSVLVQIPEGITAAEKKVMLETARTKLSMLVKEKRQISAIALSVAKAAKKEHCETLKRNAENAKRFLQERDNDIVKGVQNANKLHVGALLSAAHGCLTYLLGHDQQDVSQQYIDNQASQPYIGNQVSHQVLQNQVLHQAPLLQNQVSHQVLQIEQRQVSHQAPLLQIEQRQVHANDEDFVRNFVAKYNIQFVDIGELLSQIGSIEMQHHVQEINAHNFENLHLARHEHEIMLCDDQGKCGEPPYMFFLQDEILMNNGTFERQNSTIPLFYFSVQHLAFILVCIRVWISNSKEFYDRVLHQLGLA